MDKKKYIMRGIAIFFMLGFLVYGSYAIFNTSLIAADFNILRAKDLEISYEVQNEKGYGDLLSIKTSKPLSDKVGKNLIPYRFNVVNRAHKKRTYVLKLVRDEDITAADQCIDKQLSNNEIKYQLNSDNPKLLSDVGNSKIIYEGILNPNSSDIHEIRIWSNIQSTEIIKHYHGKIVVEMQ